MKRPLSNALKLAGLAAVALLLSAPAALAQPPQGGRLDLESLDKLAPLAAETASRQEKTPDGKGTVYVREFEFARAGAYQDSDLEAVRAQVRAPGWSLTMKAAERDRGGDEKVEIYVFTKKVGARVHGGMLIISAEPGELTVVNVVGHASVKEWMSKMRSQQKEKGK